MTATFYNTIISWAVYYFITSFNGLKTELPWKSCKHPWNSPCCVAADPVEYKKMLNLMNGTLDTINMTLVASAKNCSRLIYSTEEYFQ